MVTIKRPSSDKFVYNKVLQILLAGFHIFLQKTDHKQNDNSNQEKEPGKRNSFQLELLSSLNYSITLYTKMNDKRFFVGKNLIYIGQNTDCSRNLDEKIYYRYIRYCNNLYQFVIFVKFLSIILQHAKRPILSYLEIRKGTY